MFCPKFGKENDDNALKCTQCGAFFAEDGAPAAKAPFPAPPPAQTNGTPSPAPFASPVMTPPDNSELKKELSSLRKVLITGIVLMVIVSLAVPFVTRFFNAAKPVKYEYKTLTFDSTGSSAASYSS
ncbi:MAG TPA: hypothetical protein DCG28_03725, partial [Lachnospiraceae bacterium]|nr:hypothetical protein [Lachnospiraceae bacterium]